MAEVITLHIPRDLFSGAHSSGSVKAEISKGTQNATLTPDKVSFLKRVDNAILKRGGNLAPAIMVIPSLASLYGLYLSWKMNKRSKIVFDRDEANLKKTQNLAKDSDQGTISEKMPVKSQSANNSQHQPKFIVPPRESAMPQGGDTTNGAWA